MPTSAEESQPLCLLLTLCAHPEAHPEGESLTLF